MSCITKCSTSLLPAGFPWVCFWFFFPLHMYTFGFVALVCGPWCVTMVHGKIKSNGENTKMEMPSSGLGKIK